MVSRETPLMVHFLCVLFLSSSISHYSKPSRKTLEYAWYLIYRTRESLVPALRIVEDYILWYAHIQIMEMSYAQHKRHHSGDSHTFRGGVSLRLTPCLVTANRPIGREIFVSPIKLTNRYLSIEHYFSDEMLQTYGLKGDPVIADS